MKETKNNSVLESNNEAREVRRKLKELQDLYRLIAQGLEDIRCERPAGQDDRINALYDEIGEVVTEYQKVSEGQ